MKAEKKFVNELKKQTNIIDLVKCELFGSLGQTGNDMKTKYKETSRGGLVVNITER